MSVKRLLAVDLGASGGKCFVGTFDGMDFSMREIHRFSYEGVSFFRPNRDGTVSERVCWDDAFIYRNIVEALQTYARDIGPELDSIGVDTWGADGNLFSADGDLLGNIYCYRDHRLDNMVEQVKAKLDPSRIYEITGIHFQPFNLSNQLLWLVENRPELMLPGAFYLPVPSVFTYYLSGQKVVDSSWASVTQLMDAHDKEWSGEMLAALGIPVSIMPEIVPPGTVVGHMLPELADAVGVQAAKVIAVAAHDTASAYAAAPVDDPAEALIISSGTWSLVGKLVPEPVTSPEAMAATISNEGGVGNVRMLKNCMGTWLVQELRRVWRVEDGVEMAWRELDEATEKAPAFSAFIDPDDPTFYNPINMRDAIVAFCEKTGQTAPRDRGTFARVVYESLALKYRYVNEQICGVTGTHTSVVNIVGGGTKNIMLNQFTADALGVPVCAGPEEGTAVGNLMVQAVGLGIIDSLADAQPIIRGAFPITEYRPHDTEAWNSAYEQFVKFVG